MRENWQTNPSLSQIQGLSEDEAENIRRQKDADKGLLHAGPTFLQILRKNIFTIFNLDLVGLVSLQLFFGQPLSAFLSFLVLMLSILISVFQERWAWNRIELLAQTTGGKATVIRGGKIKEIDLKAVVSGDVVVAGFGDQILADGIILSQDHFEVYESLVTESTQSVAKEVGSRVYAGNICVAGRAAYQVEEVAIPELADQLFEQSTHIYPENFSPLQKLIDRLLRVLLVIVAIFSAILVFDYFLDTTSLVNRSSLAGMIFVLAPSGLFFMIVVTYAVGAARIADKGALVPIVSSIESLAQASVLCLGRLGTLTQSRLHIEEIVSNSDQQGSTREVLQLILGDYAHSISSQHSAFQVLRNEFQGQKRHIYDEAALMSAYGWSGIAFDDDELSGTLLLGDPKLLEPYILTADESSPTISQIKTSASFLSRLGSRTRDIFTRTTRVTGDRISKYILLQTSRVLVLAYRDDVVSLHDQYGTPHIPGGLIPLCFLRLSEDVSQESVGMLDKFIDAGVELKLLSTEDPTQVLDLAEQVGLVSNDNRSKNVVSGHDMAAMDGDQFERTVFAGRVFSHLTPEIKGKIVDTLRASGNYVAMVGDDLSDLFAMRNADLGISMRIDNYSLRNLSHILLLDNSLAALAKVFTEGQMLVNGLVNALKIYLTRIMYFVIFVIAIGLLGLGFPYTGKMAALIGLVTVDIPAIVLALSTRPGVLSEGDLRRKLVLFVFPAGLLTSLFGFLIYLYFYFSTNNVFYSQLVLTYTLIGCGALIVLFSDPPLKIFAVAEKYRGNNWSAIVELVLVALFFILARTNIGKELFDIQPLSRTVDYLVIVGVLILWFLALWSTWRYRLLERFLPHGSDFQGRIT